MNKMVKYFLLIVAVLAGTLLSVGANISDEFDSWFGYADDCNYTLNDIESSFASPNYPEQYNQNCTWNLETQNGNLYLTFVDFYVDGVNDSLLIYDGEATDKLIGNFSSVGKDAKTGTFLVISSGSKLTIKLTSFGNMSDTYRRRFSVQYTNGTECKSDLGDLWSGYLGGVYLYNPPSSNTSDKDVLECTYTLSAMPASKIAFSFDKTDLKGEMTFTSGNQTKKYTGGTYFSDFISETEAVKIVYKINNIASSVQVSFLHISDCGKSNVELDDTTESAELELFSRIGDDLDCWWLIKAPADTTVMGVFESLMVDNYLITIRDGGMKTSQLIALDTGEEGEISTVLTTSEYLWIRFQSNKMAGGTISLITVIAQEYGKQFFVSSDLPPITMFALDTADDVATQFYRFSASSDYLTIGTDQVQLNFDACTLNDNASMTFYDGDSDSAPVITVFDYSECYPVFSSGQYIFLVVDGFKNGSLFTGNFSAVEAGCHGNYMDEAGGFSLEASIMTDTQECGWLVNPSGGGTAATVMFTQINTDLGSNITVYYGFGTYGPKLAHIAGGTLKRSPVIVSNDPEGGPLFVQYVQKAAKKNGDTIFKAVYGKLGPCQRSVTAMSSGELKTPQFPNYYPLNANCAHNVTVPDGKLIHLYYDTFKLYEKHSSQVVEHTGNTSTVIASYTGNVLPNDMVLNTSQVDVTFSSVMSNITDLTVNQGFNIKYTLLECGGNLTGSGDFSTPEYPNPVVNKTTCIWIITVPAITKKKSTIVSLTFKPSEVKNESSNYIRIRDGPSQRSDLIANTSVNNAVELTLLSTYHYLWVQYVFEPNEKVTEGFHVKFSYNSYECDATCNNKVCMHPDWKCDGIDQCGDNTDEQNCKDSSFSAVAIVLTLVLTFIVTVFLTLGVPRLVRKYKARKYTSMSEEEKM